MQLDHGRHIGKQSYGKNHIHEKGVMMGYPKLIEHELNTPR